MASYEVLYRKACRNPLSWSEVRERIFQATELLDFTLDKVKMIRDRLRATQDCQISYVDTRSRPLEFDVGDFVFLKVASWKGIVRFHKRGKLPPQYIRPYEIIEHVEPVVYLLRLPTELQRIHDVFYVSMLQKYMADPSNVVGVPLVEIAEDITFPTQPVVILEKS